MRAHVVVTLLDGKKAEATGEYMALADRVAYERRFNESAMVLSQMSDVFDEKTGKVKKGADISGVREEWLAFFAWRLLKREGVAGEDYDSFLDSVADVSVDVEPDPPTRPAPRSTS